MDEELFRRMQDAALRFRSGQSDCEEIMTPNGLARIVRDANDPRGFRIDFVGDGARHSVPVQEYPPSQRRVPGYPAPLPFLEDCAAVVNTVDQSVTWRDLPDPERAFERVAQQCLDDGWTENAMREDAETGPSRAFEKEGAERVLMLLSDDGPPRLVLREREAKRLPGET